MYQPSDTMTQQPQLQELLDRLQDTKTRLDKTSHLDEEDVGLSYTQTLLVPNKIDVPGADERLELLHELCPLDFAEHVISAEHGTGLEELRTAIFQALDVVRVYSKAPTHKTADFERPFTVRRGGTVLDVVDQIHKDFVANFKFARVWGSQIHDGTQVKADYQPHDKDVVEFHV